MIALKPYLLTLLLLFASAPVLFSAKSNASFDVSPDVREIYDLLLDFRLDEAEARIDGLSDAEPTNLMVHYLADYVDFLRIFAHDDLALYQSSKSSRQARLRLVSMGAVNSPYYLFVQAEIYLHRALLRMRFGEQFSAASDINTAFKLLRRNDRKFPGFAPNLKSLGMLRAAFGTLPEEYKWAIELLSNMEGSVEQGMTDLTIALEDTDQLTYRETQYMYMLALLHFENAPDRALAYAQEVALLGDHDLTQCFILSHLALKSGRNQMALAWIEAARKRTDITRLPHLLLMHGIAKLQRQDIDADEVFEEFLSVYRGESYRKATLQKLAWHALLQGDTRKFSGYISRCVMEGNAILDQDKYALSEAEHGAVPDPALLKARLLFDGGYDFRALEVLESMPYDELSREEKIEFRYRAGRVYHRIGRDFDALFSYKAAMSDGSNSKEYYACAAALYAGLLYEDQDNIELADQYFKMCLQMHPDQYQAGLHQKAKAGLSRMRLQQAAR